MAKHLFSILENCEENYETFNVLLPKFSENSKSKFSTQIFVFVVSQNFVFGKVVLWRMRGHISIFGAP